MFDNKEPITVGMRVRIDHPTSRLHGETGTIKTVRGGDFPAALFVSEQFPQCDPQWLDVRIVHPIPKDANAEDVLGGDREGASTGEDVGGT